MSPCEILAYAKAQNEIAAEQFKRDVSIAYLNAKLGRAEKMPPLSKILADRKPPSFKEIVARLKAAPTYKQA